MKHTYTQRTIKVPEIDCDFFLKFPSGKVVQIQCRPSNADVDYNGSLDIILPDNQYVINWKGDHMAPSKASSKKIPYERFAKQLCTELP